MSALVPAARAVLDCQSRAGGSPAGFDLAVNPSQHAIAGLENFQDRDGSEDLSNERLELDTFDYRTYYMNDLRTRDSDTEPTIYGSDSESSDEGF